VARAVGTRVALVGRTALVVAGSTDRLHDVATGPRADDPVTRVRVVVAHWQHRSWSVGVAPTPNLVHHRVALPHLRHGAAVVTLRYAPAVPLAHAVRSALTALAPASRWPATTTAAGTDAGPHFDATRVNPCGRRPDTYLPTAPAAHLTTDRLDGATLAALRRAGTVTVPPGITPGTLAAVCATGALVDATAAPARDALAPELRAILATPHPGDPLAVEAHSVRQRRAALRHHAAAFATGVRPAVSALLATRRPDRIAPALAMLAAQTYPDLEIVLCLHGVAPPPDLSSALAGRPHQVVEVPAEVSFGTALGLASARAGGTLLTKVDDDDTYGPEHVWDLVLARHYSGATLVGKGSELVLLEGSGTLVRRDVGRAEDYGAVVAGGTMLLARADLEAVGGWRPVARSVDLGLIQRLRRAGGTVYRTHSLGYVYHRRAAGHTWDPGEAYFVDAARATWPGIPPEALA